MHWELYPLGEDTVFMDKTSDRFFVLNDTARFMLQCVEGGLRKKETVDAVVQEYRMPPDIAERDVERFWNFYRSEINGRAGVEAFSIPETGSQNANDIRLQNNKAILSHYTPSVNGHEKDVDLQQVEKVLSSSRSCRLEEEWFYSFNGRRFSIKIALMDGDESFHSLPGWHRNGAPEESMPIKKVGLAGSSDGSDPAGNPVCPDKVVQDVSMRLRAKISAMQSLLKVKTDASISVIIGQGNFAVLLNDRLVSLEETLAGTEAAFTEALVKELHPGLEPLAVLHAAGVGGKTRCMLLPGTSGRGKTSIAAALIRKGYSYMGDDLIPLDRNSLHAFSVPLSMCIKKPCDPFLLKSYPELRSHDWLHPDFNQHERKALFHLPPPYSSFVDRRTDLPVSCLVFPFYMPGEKMMLFRILPVESFCLLVEAGSWISRVPEDMDRLIRWIQKIPAYRLIYSCIEDAEKKIMRLIGR